jgi:anti-sigma factor RsiW
MDLKAELERRADEKRPAEPIEKVITAVLMLQLVEQATAPMTYPQDRDFVIRNRGLSSLVFWWDHRTKHWVMSNVGAKRLLAAGREKGLWT